jgi:hypothetical protein
MSTIDISTGLSVAGMQPTDPKGFFLSEAILKDLGTNNNLAFRYYDGMVTYTADTGKSFRWRKYKQGETGGLITNGYTYPAGVVAEGVTYGAQKYNFFEITYGAPMIPYLYLFPKAKGEGNVLSVLEAGDLVEGFKDNLIYWDCAIYTGGDPTNRANYIPLVETAIGEEVGTAPVNGVDGNNGASAYELAVVGGYIGTVTQWIASIQGNKGEPGTAALSLYQIAVNNGFIGTEPAFLLSLKGTNGVNGISAYQVAVNNGYVGTEPNWLITLKGASGTNASNNLQRDVDTDFTLRDADNNFVIQLKNTVNIIITVPASALRAKFNCGFIRKGTGEVTFVGAYGVTLENPVGFRIGVINDSAYLERDNASQIYTLLGTIKV